jgi:hypothetical protein
MTSAYRHMSGQMMLGAARIKAEAVAAGGDPSAGSEYAKRATTSLSETPEIGVGGEIIPNEDLGFIAPDLRNTLANPTLITVDASRDRLNLLERVGALELGLDLADTINPQNTAELALAHQLAAAHQGAMKLIAQMNEAAKHAGSNDALCARAARLAGAASRLMVTYQQGLLTVRQLRQGGKQSVTVTHIVQQVNVEDGGQAVVAGKNVKTRSKGGGGQSDR